MLGSWQPVSELVSFAITATGDRLATFKVTVP